VYLSGAKLNQFLPERGSSWRWSKLTVKLPIGGFEFDRAPGNETGPVRRLDEVVDKLAYSAASFTAVGLRPGHWVQFEAPLNYLVIEGGDFDDMVLFTDPAEATEQYPTGGETRLLLHGSSCHLIGTCPAPATAAVDGEARFKEGRRGSDPQAVVHAAKRADRLLDMFGQKSPGRKVEGNDPHTFTHVARRADLLLDMFGHKSPGRDADLPRWDEWPNDDLRTATDRLLHVLGQQVSPETAAWMTGYARVTAVLPVPQGQAFRVHTSEPDPFATVSDRVFNSYASAASASVVIATPLYVEYSTPPQAGPLPLTE
jgi:hypothetical protein